MVALEELRLKILDKKKIWRARPGVRPWGDSLNSFIIPESPMASRVKCMVDWASRRSHEASRPIKLRPHGPHATSRPTRMRACGTCVCVCRIGLLAEAPRALSIIHAQASSKGWRARRCRCKRRRNRLQKARLFWWTYPCTHSVHLELRRHGLMWPIGFCECRWNSDYLWCGL